MPYQWTAFLATVDYLSEIVVGLVPRALARGIPSQFVTITMVGLTRMIDGMYGGVNQSKSIVSKCKGTIQATIQATYRLRNEICDGIDLYNTNSIYKWNGDEFFKIMNTIPLANALALAIGNCGWTKSVNTLLCSCGWSKGVNSLHGESCFLNQANAGTLESNDILLAVMKGLKKPASFIFTVHKAQKLSQVLYLYPILCTYQNQSWNSRKDEALASQPRHFPFTVF